MPAAVVVEIAVAAAVIAITADVFLLPLLLLHVCFHAFMQLWIHFNSGNKNAIIATV